MLVAINYSSAAAELCRLGRLEIDRFKTPDWPDMVAEAQTVRPAAVHFSLVAGDGKLKHTDWQQIDRLREQTGTRYINLHLDGDNRHFKHIPSDSLKPAHQQEVLEAMLADLQYAVKRYGAENVIAENCPYRPGGHMLAASAIPEIISQAIETAGCGLLFDIAHAHISAVNLGMDIQAYICQLPVERIREMHFTGILDVDGWLQDHRPATPADWADLEFCLASIRRGEWAKPWMTAFEYGGVGGKFTGHTDPHIIEEQGRRLHTLLHDL